MNTRLGVSVEALESELREAVDGEVRFDDGTLAAYSTDASNYRQVPIGVVLPRTPDAAAAAVRVAARHRAPVLSRGGGTSLAGECTNTALVIDWSKYCHDIEHVDLEHRSAIVQPGVVLDVLNAHLEPHGLRFGPEPSTHPNCTLGGMLGNNSCGATAQRYGKTGENVRRLEVITSDGERFWIGRADDERFPDLTWDAVMAAGGRRAEIYRQLKDRADEYGDRIRKGFPDIPRRVSGYSLDALLPENGFDVAKAVVGTHIVKDDADKTGLWKVREGGLGATARPGGPAETKPDAWPGWEDAAVDPHRLGDYLREYEALLKRYDYENVSVYGHFGDGCVHCRIPFDLITPGGIANFKAFLHDA